MSLAARRVRGNLDDDFNLDWNVERQLVRADRASRMFAGVAEDLDEQIGRTVNHPGLPREPGGAVDPADELHDPPHAIERSDLGT